MKGLCIKMFDDEELDEMTLEELDAELANTPKEILGKVDEILRAFGIALGEARAAYVEKLMKEIEEENKSK